VLEILTKALGSAVAKLIVKGIDAPDEVIELKPGINRLGRSVPNDFQILNPTISRFHCEIEVRGDGMFVRDLDSSNGTFVDENPITEAKLESGQTLRLGDVEMLVKDAPEPASKGSGPPPCYNHPGHPASMQCRQCHRFFCGVCVHILRRMGGKILRLCPVCSGHCEPLQKVEKRPKKLLSGVLNKLFGKSTRLLRRHPKDPAYFD
jgi:hypothetical protein